MRPFVSHRSLAHQVRKPFQYRSSCLCRHQITRLDLNLPSQPFHFPHGLDHFRLSQQHQHICIDQFSLEASIRSDKPSFILAR